MSSQRKRRLACDDAATNQASWAKLGDKSGSGAPTRQNVSPAAREAAFTIETPKPLFAAFHLDNFRPSEHGIFSKSHADGRKRVRPKYRTGSDASSIHPSATRLCGAVGCGNIPLRAFPIYPLGGSAAAAHPPMTATSGPAGPAGAGSMAVSSVCLPVVLSNRDIKRHMHKSLAIKDSALCALVHGEWPPGLANRGMQMQCGGLAMGTLQGCQRQ